MKTKLRFVKSLLVMAALCLGSSSAWATPTVIKTYDFYTASVNSTNETTLSFSGTTTINKTACDNATGEWEGICLQGSGSWFLNRGGKHAYEGLYNNNGGGRLFGLIGLKGGDIVTVNANGGLPTSATNGTYDEGHSTTTSAIYTVTADGNFAISLTRYYQITTVTLTRDVADLEAPTYTITGTNGVNRQVTISCLTGDATIKYNTVSDKSAGGWITYAAAFYTSESTLYAYSEKGDNTSEVITITTGAGSTIKLNTPTLTKTAYADGAYTITLSSTQADLAVVPTSTVLYYSIDGGSATEYTGAFSLSAGSTATAYATSDGYDNSSETSLTAVARPIFAENWKIDFASQATADKGGVTVSDVAFTANEESFGTITADNYTSNDNFGVKTGTSWLLRNTGTQGLYSMNGTNTPIGIANLTEGQYVIINCFGQGNFIQNAAGSVEYSSDLSTSGQIVLYVKEDGNAYINLTRYIYIQSIIVYDAATSVSKTISAAGWATYCSPYALDFTGAIANLDDAFIVTGGAAGVLTKTSVKGETVPANTGLLLKGNGECTIPVVSSGTAVVAANKLVGVTSNTEIAANAGYVLMGTPSLGFYQNSNAFTVGANTAYLPADFAGAGARTFFQLDAETTGINAIENAETVNGIYNLAGQRVAQPTRGLYIVNGKKIVVK